MRLAGPDRLEQASRFITLAAFAIASISFLAAPVIALSWRQVPFPGFMVEPNLVVNDRDGEGWAGRALGLASPQLVTRIATLTVENTAGFQAALAARTVGENTAVFTRTPDGTVRLYPSVPLQAFPNRDFNAMFWLPYLIGLAYLGIGVWVYWASGSTRPGRTLAFFCICVALATGLLFDVLTTHLLSGLWLASTAFLGGSLVSLSLRFPVEWRPVAHRPWLLAVPYLLSAFIAVWCLQTIHSTADPWSFNTARAASYRYAAFGAVFFLGVVYYRARTSISRAVQRQSRIVLLGSFLAFAPVVVWFTSPLAGLTLPFNGWVFLPELLLFPVSVATAILRYRLLELDTLVNRAIVYGILTAILAGLFTAAVGLSQRVFVGATGEKSDAAVVLTTLIVVALATPIKNRLQGFVDRQFREAPSLALKEFGDQARAYVEFHDPELLGQRFLDECVRSMSAESGALIRFHKGQPKLAHTVGHWLGRAQVSIPLLFDGHPQGVVLLGPRRFGRAYRQQDVESLARVSRSVSHAIQIVTDRSNGPR